MIKPLFILLCSVSAVVSLSTHAETIKVPIGQQSASQQAMPRTGITKAAVEEQFGSPISKSDAVGEPPISNWEYADFVVYFEYDHVIHAVAKHRPQAQ